MARVPCPGSLEKSLFVPITNVTHWGGLGAQLPFLGVRRLGSSSAAELMMWTAPPRRFRVWLGAVDF
jgi:hypothetical protein